MPGIKLVPQYADSHGVLHATQDAAVAAERRIMLTDILVRRRGDLSLSLSHIPPLVEIIVETHEAVHEVMKRDLTRDFHRGGVLGRATPTLVGSRPNEHVVPNRAPGQADGRTGDSKGHAIEVGTPVRLVRRDEQSIEKWGARPIQTVTGIDPDGYVRVAHNNWAWPPDSIAWADDRQDANAVTVNVAR